MQSIWKRRRKGHSIAELGPALFMILIIMIFPLATLASLGIRYTFLFYAARNAVREASRCTQFSANQSAYQLSAVNRANQMMNTWAAGFNGLTGINTVTYIQVCNVGTGAMTTYFTPIPTGVPIDTTNNVYNIVCRVTGNVAPLFPASNWFNIQGLTAPFPVQILCAAMAEKPSGLKY
jgi:hypothetical protein